MSDQQKTDAALTALEKIADQWAIEVNLAHFVTAIHQDPLKADALIRQFFIEGAYRGFLHGQEIERHRAPSAPQLPALNDDLIEILGRPNFACGQMAHAFKAAGYAIKEKAEDEQAFIIHWLLGLYLADPENWRKQAGKELGDVVDKAKSKTTPLPEPPQ